MKWNHDWRNELKEKHYDCYIRLCECNNTVEDIKLMTVLLYKYNPTESIEDCFELILEWVGDWNSQYDLTDFTTDEYYAIYDEICKRIKKSA